MEIMVWGDVMHSRNPDLWKIQEIFGVAIGAGNLHCLDEYFLGTQWGTVEMNAYSLTCG